MSDLREAEAALRDIFGFSSFRPGQDEIVRSILAGRDVLAVMPTGSGKSLCYQLPAILRGGLTVVVSPLIALMRNQVAQLRLRNRGREPQLGKRPCREPGRSSTAGRGDLRLLYIAPERLTKPDTLGLLKRANVSLLAVDEAHCVSQWGHDFRPEYMTLGAVQAELGNAQIIALTATADAATRGEIVAKLFIRAPDMFVHGFDRPNLRLTSVPNPRAGGR